MLIKIDDERYINSEHIRAILPFPGFAIAPVKDPHKDGVFLVYLGDGVRVEVSQPVVDYLVQVLDANDAAVFEQPDVLPLKSRIAIFLRNQAEGQSINDLLIEFHEDADKDVLLTILNELGVANVIKAYIVPATSELYYYHASNPVVAGSTDGPAWQTTPHN